MGFRIEGLYDEALADLPIIRPPHAAAGDVHSWHVYVTQLADGAGVARDVFIERLFEQGIGCRQGGFGLMAKPDV
jgi:dTDP-4-amino-4,6-dideoxygalactose transaminase